VSSGRSETRGRDDRPEIAHVVNPTPSTPPESVPPTPLRVKRRSAKTWSCEAD